MLRTDLIDLINRRSMWAFVGSGVSVDAGGPTWRQLLDGVVAKLDEKIRQQLTTDGRFRAALSQQSYPKCFSRIQAFVGRQRLEEFVSADLHRLSSPGEVARHVADWPFAAYITANYDSVLSIALRQLGERGWLEVGNSRDEVRKISGDASNVIWHVHGATRITSSREHTDPDKFRMILTEEDYDQLYLEGSPLVNQLRSLLSQKRIVFIGFGFQDPELMRLLRLVGIYGNPARPAFAFLGGLGGTEHEARRVELLERYNVDVIPYEVFESSHKQLDQLLKIYSSFTLRRTQRFGQPDRACPSYDPETTGLLVYNQLALRRQAGVSEDLLATLLKARILSVIKFHGPTTIDSLITELAERAKLVRAGPLTNGDDKRQFIERCVASLVSEGMVSWAESVSLTPAGDELLAAQSAASTRLYDQFVTCLRDRAAESFPQDEAARLRVARAAEAFLKECVSQRALGVAMSWYAPSEDFRRFHVLGLIQALPGFIQQLASDAEALALIRLVEDLFAKPNEAEARYVGFALQAHFSVTVLGYDAGVVQARVRELSKTIFLIDSSTLIRFLARSNHGYKTALLLMQRLRAVGAAVATTKMLAREVAEHLRWALGHSKELLSERAFVVASGRAGSHANIFLDGFLEEVSRGQSALDFGKYLDTVCDDAEGHTGADNVLIRVIERKGIPCHAFKEWPGYRAALVSQIGDLQSKIAQWRKERHSYKHDRQVRAEAEALIIIQELRTQRFGLDAGRFKDAYFISNTRAIDIVAGGGLPITMRPAAALQWLSTLQACGPEELGVLTSGLLWEMSERGLEIIDRKRLQTVFSPLISAAKERLSEELATHRSLMANRYGESGTKAFSDLDEVDLTVAVHVYYAQKASELEEQLARETVAKRAAEAKAKMTEQDRADLARFRAKQKQKHLRAVAKQRGRRRKKKRR